MLIWKSFKRTLRLIIPFNCSSEQEIFSFIIQISIKNIYISKKIALFFKLNLKREYCLYFSWIIQLINFFRDYLSTSSINKFQSPFFYLEIGFRKLYSKLFLKNELNVMFLFNKKTFNRNINSLQKFNGRN